MLPARIVVLKTSTLYLNGLKQLTRACPPDDLSHFFFHPSHITAPLFFFTFTLDSFVFCFAPDIHQTTAIIVFERHFRQLKGREHGINGSGFVSPILFSPSASPTFPSDTSPGFPFLSIAFALSGTRTITLPFLPNWELRRAMCFCSVS